MIGKTFKLFGVILFTLVMCLSLVSSLIVSTTELTFTNADNSNDLVIINDDSNNTINVDKTFTPIPMLLDNQVITFNSNPSFPFSLDAGNHSTVTITMNDIDWNNVDFKDSVSGILTISDGTEEQNVSIIVKKQEFCEYNNPGDLEVEINDIQNNGFGKDDEWYPLDEIEVEVEVENDGNDNMEDISLEWGFYSKDNEEWIIDVDEEDEFDLDEGDTEVVTFSFNLNKKDLDVDLDELDDGDYTFYVRATGNNEDNTNEISCETDSDSIEVLIEDDFVTLSDINVVGDTFCGSIVQITADIWNIGSDDQDDVQIEVYNNDLGIDETVTINEIESFKDKDLSIEFTLPKDIEEKRYYLDLTVYDEDGDIYENSDNDESSFTIALDVEGNCEIIPNAAVFASLESGGMAGAEMQIKATVTNNGDETETFQVGLGDYASWAELVEIDPETATIEAGGARDVLITLNVNPDASSTETLNIILEGTDGGILTQPIEVSIEQSFLSKILRGNNNYLWGIALLNIILVIVIIIIAIKVARK